MKAIVNQINKEDLKTLDECVKLSVLTLDEAIDNNNIFKNVHKKNKESILKLANKLNLQINLKF